MKTIFFILFFLVVNSTVYSQENIPENFPDEVPLPNYSLYDGSINTKDGGTVLRFVSSQTIKENLDYFKTEMQRNSFDLDELGETLMNDSKGGIISWNKGTREVALLLGINYDTYRTAIIITYK